MFFLKNDITKVEKTQFCHLHNFKTPDFGCDLRTLGQEIRGKCVHQKYKVQFFFFRIFHSYFIFRYVIPEAQQLGISRKFQNRKTRDLGYWGRFSLSSTH